MRPVVALVVALAIQVAGEAAVRAQVSSTATPVFHGVLHITVPAAGTIDRSTGIARLRVRGWRWALAANSKGILPGQEPLVVAFGDDSFPLPAGTLKASRSGKVFRYRAPPDAGSRAIQSFRLARRADGSYSVTLALTGLNLSRLVLETPVCMPMAVIVGEDDGFTGVNVTRPSFQSRRVAIAQACNVNTWPWLQG